MHWICNKGACSIDLSAVSNKPLVCNALQKCQATLLEFLYPNLPLILCHYNKHTHTHTHTHPHTHTCTRTRTLTPRLRWHDTMAIRSEAGPGGVAYIAQCTVHSAQCTLHSAHCNCICGSSATLYTHIIYHTGQHTQHICYIRTDTHTHT